ncbi:MAG: helix-turn-helix transcriptional regulator [Myxococcota bacterium]
MAASIFRERLQQLIDESGLSKSAFAGRIGIDRSTLSQCLGAESTRLPRTDTLLQLATRLDVSLDWLLGLSEQGAIAPALLEYTEFPERTAADELLAHWHAQAAGFKIRYVPTTLPDFVKTDRVLDYEFRPTSEKSVEAERRKRQQRLHYQRQPETDMEVVSPFQELELLAYGKGTWSGLSLAERKGQLAEAIELVDELYPSLRWSLYDSRRRFASPVTVFGLQRAVLYVGDAFLALNGRDLVRAFARRFDSMVRSAAVEPTATGRFLRDLWSRVR